MNWIRRTALFFFALSAMVFTGCGMQHYPGQPDVVTNGYSKIDLEMLQPDGLWVYETTYDNRQNGKGVAAIVSKLYPGALTYTSNVRTNADGTLYRVKGQYAGAEVHMISFPKMNQIMLPPESHVNFMISQKLSLDEIDDRNLAENNLFKKAVPLTPEALGLRRFRWDLLRAGRLKTNGSLAYEVTAIEIGQRKFTPSAPVSIETNFLQNGVRTNLSKEARAEAIQFLESHFPKGFEGEAKLSVKGSAEPLTVTLGIHTAKTAEASGVTVVRNVSQQKLREALNQIGLN